MRIFIDNVNNMTVVEAIAALDAAHMKHSGGVTVTDGGIAYGIILSEPANVHRTIRVLRKAGFAARSEQAHATRGSLLRRGH